MHLADGVSNSVNIPVIDHSVKVSHWVNRAYFFDYVIWVRLSVFQTLSFEFFRHLLLLLLFSGNDVFPKHSFLFRLLNHLFEVEGIFECYNFLLGILKQLAVWPNLVCDILIKLWQLTCFVGVSNFVGHYLREVLQSRVEGHLRV